MDYPDGMVVVLKDEGRGLFLDLNIGSKNNRHHILADTADSTGDGR